MLFSDKVPEASTLCVCGVCVCVCVCVCVRVCACVCDVCVCDVQVDVVNRIIPPSRKCCPASCLP